MARPAPLPALLLLLALVLPSVTSQTTLAVVEPSVAQILPDQTAGQCLQQAAVLTQQLEEKTEELQKLRLELESLKEELANRDADKCLAGTHNCHAQATCTNTDDGFQCTCNSGYRGNGQRCSKICESPNFQVGIQCFYLSEDKKTWSSALTACEERGGSLAEPINPRKLIEKLKEFTTDYVFLGGSEPNKDGKWVGVSGLPFNTKGYWSRGEPNNYGGIEEDCLAVDNHGNGLNDAPCDNSVKYLCEV